MRGMIKSDKHFSENNYKMRKIICNRSGQVWVETVIYTLIGIAIMGILIATTAPRIEEWKDRALIEQSMESLGEINAKISELQKVAPGNQRSFNLKIGKGKLIIDSKNDKIYWELDIGFEYGESGTSIMDGIINTTTLGDDPWTVRLEIPLPVNIKVRYNGKEEQKEFGESPTPYRFSVKNEGIENGKIVINIREVA